MYKDIINYKLAEGISEKQLLAVANRIIESWMSKQPRFQKWEIHKNQNDDYTDIVYWQSKEDAKKSESDMVNIPNADEWFACYEKGSIESVNLSLLASLK